MPLTLRDLVGINGRVWGLNHFGYSAPFKVLDEKFGFNGENIYLQVCDFLKI
jgi:transketolase